MISFNNDPTSTWPSTNSDQDTTYSEHCWSNPWNGFAEVAADGIINDAIKNEKLWHILKLAEQAREVVRVLSRIVFSTKSIWIRLVLIKIKLLFSISGHLSKRLRKRFKNT